MKNKNRGVTLVALVVTIVVLLILAGVSVATLTGGNGLIDKAQVAKNETEKKEELEKITLAHLNSKRNRTGTVNYDTLNKELKDIIDGQDTISYLPATVTGKTGQKYKITEDEVTVKDSSAKPGDADSTTGLFTETSTINGGEASAINPTIPAGFKPVNVTKEQSATPATWGDGTNAPSEQSVKNGLVITDGINEFVWIPVKNIGEMAKPIDGTNDNNENKKYRGVLYNFNSDKKQNSEIAWSTDSTSYREPANLSDIDEAGNVYGWTSTLYQEEYDKMVKQVEKYHGFYVGRYEMSLNSTTGEAQSKGGETSANASADSANQWYGLYTKAKTYAPDTQENTKSVVSSMIWGSQYDAMMRWMQENGVDVTETPTSTPSPTLQNAVRNKGSTTGGENNKDVINNVYDLLGNRFEWTQEADDTDRRVVRGAVYSATYSPSQRRTYSTPSYDSASHGSRFTLYIK